MRVKHRLLYLKQRNAFVGEVDYGDCLPQKLPDGAVKDILECVAPGDDVSDFSDLSQSDEEEWTAPSTGEPDHSSDDEEADDF
ncbi:hypothetical protein MTO96_015282 [Rhipicephalus appendiculatus]